tara:strand:+ start:749 stop:1813 length:1065 start_codon:yes stop_codon:yes gene_type:complete
MFNIDKTRTAPRAVVTKNNVHSSQANLDFSEEAVSGNSQHDNIMGGQGLPTNQDGSQANTDFSPQAIQNNGVSQIGSGDPNLRVHKKGNNIMNRNSGQFSNSLQKTFFPTDNLPWGAVHAEEVGNSTATNFFGADNSTKTTPPTTNSTDISVPVPVPESTPTPPQVETQYQPISDLGFTQGTIDPKTRVSTTGGNAFSFTPNDTKIFAVQMGSNNKPIGGNQFNSNKMSEAMYNTKISNQERDSISSLPSMRGWESLGTPPKVESTKAEKDKKQKDEWASFFSGTKSGNETFTDNNIKMKDGTQSQTKGYADVTPFDNKFNDPFNVSTETFSNEKKNKKALQDQFDMYSKFSNF